MFRAKWRYVIVGALALAVVMMGCNEALDVVDDVIGDGATTVAGGSAMMHGGEITSWATLNNNGDVVAVSARLPLAVVQNGTTAEFDPTGPPMEENVRLSMPPVVVNTTFVNHLDIGYNPAGHPPIGIYTVPHFDLHFYAMTESEQLAVDGSDMTPVPQERLPANYVAGKPGLPPDGDCIPQMGIHAFDVTSPELAPENPEPFTKTMILGYYGGAQNFVEPMITREVFLQRKNFSMVVPKPSSLGRATRYPTRFVATYDSRTDSYVLTATDFVAIQ